ncbi:MAG: agmatinase, partial [Oscillospiraceae bacterium]
NKNIHTFIGCDSEYEDANIVVFGAPFDCTTSFRPGTRFASSVIRNESFGIETYSPYQDKDLADYEIFDAGDLELPFGNPQPAIDNISKMTEKILKDNKIPFMVGGEHLVTLGAVKKVYEKYPNLHIIHFDAHTDLRDEYLGSRLSHASVIKRCHDLIGDNKIFQFGIRSGEREEFLWAEKHTHLCKFNFDSLNYAIEKIKNEPCYFTLDLDILDPSVFPGTGTPEAGGVTFIQLLEAIIKISKLNIVGVDVNELCPVYDQSGSSTATACKLIREILLALQK